MKITRIIRDTLIGVSIGLVICSTILNTYAIKGLRQDLTVLRQHYIIQPMLDKGKEKI